MILETDKSSQNNDWQRVAVPIGGLNDALVVIEVTVGSGYGGHVAIDDIEFINCGLTERVPGTCNFEHGSCGYKEFIVNDEFNWMLNQGPTPSYYTGPDHDHTYRKYS